MRNYMCYFMDNSGNPVADMRYRHGDNAISGIAVLGALIIAGPKDWNITVILGLIAIVLATINVIGGFMVTNRMLAMFKRK